MIWAQLIERLTQAPNKVAIHYDDSSLTYAELIEHVLSLAENLDFECMQPRRVLVQEKDQVSLLMQVLACWSRGAVPVVLRRSMSAMQVDEIKRYIRPVAAFSDLPLNSVQSPRLTSLAKACHRFAARDEALVICTSGTTGKPKLVALPAESVCQNATAIGRALNLSAKDIVAVHTPLGYMYGLMGGCIATLWQGGTCCILSPNEPPTRLQAEIRRRGISVVQAPPAYFRLFFSYWNQEPFSSVRMLTTGGEPLSADLTEALERAFPQASKLFLYGMTEAGPRISDMPFERGGGINNCIGLPYSHLEWRIESVEQSIASNNVGRLALRGPSMFLGYIAPDGGYEGLGADGYFSSNDLVSLDPSERLHFHGRIDRIFRSGGKLVNPEYVEQILRLHPAVKNVSCFPEPHPILGLVLSAQLEFKETCSVNTSELIQLCAHHGEAHTIPRRFEIVSQWEIAESGKASRSKTSHFS